MAKRPAELTEAYSLNEIQNHTWKIQSCCAITGEGLEEGINWLSGQIMKNAQNANNTMQMADEESGIVGQQQQL